MPQKINTSQQLNAVTTDTNPGTAGGSRNYINLGGLKVCWGVTASISAPVNSEVSRDITFPTSFFASAPSFSFNMSQASASVTGNYVVGNNVSASNASIYWRNSTASTGVGGAVSWIAIGI